MTCAGCIQLVAVTGWSLEYSMVAPSTFQLSGGGGTAVSAALLSLALTRSQVQLQRGPGLHIADLSSI